MPELARQLPRVEQPDRAAAVAGLVLAVLLFPLRFYSGEVYVQVLPPLLAVASLLYLLARRFPDRPGTGLEGTLSSGPTRAAAGLTFVGVGLLALLAAQAGGRTPIFFVVAAAIGTGILAQVLLVERAALRPGLVLAELLSFALVVRYAAILTTPGLVGVDIWTHVTDYAASIQAANSLAPLSDVKYGAAPFYHVLVVTVADATGLSLKLSAFLAVGLVVTVGCLLLYGTVSHFLPRRWALFAVSLFVMADHVIRWGIHLIPTSLGLVFFLGALYAITRLYYDEARGRDYVLALVFCVGTVLTHQLSAFVLMVVLGAGAAAHLADRFRAGSSAGRPALGSLFLVQTGLVTASFAQTPYHDTSLLSGLVGAFSHSLTTTVGFLNLASSTGGEAAALGVTPTPFAVSFVDALGFFALLLVVVVGSLTVLRRDSSTLVLSTYFAAAVATAVVTLGFPLFGFNLVLPSRWYAFMYAPMAGVAALGCWFLARRLPRRAALGGLLALALVFPGAMLIQHKATPENPVFEEQYTRYSYTSEELAAVRTIGAHRPASAGPLYADHPYRTVFTRSGSYAANPIVLVGGAASHDAVVYRHYDSVGAPVFLAGESAVTIQRTRQQICGGRDRVYDDAAVTLCLSGPGA
ncbi:MAG: hypothetical protein ABEJ89_08815 [Haloarculaceae archaeon]